MTKRSIAIACLGMLGGLLAAACSPMNFSVNLESSGRGFAQTPVFADPAAGRWKVAVIDLTGLIADVRRPGLLSRGENIVDRTVSQLQAAEDDSEIKAVILRINSPGGTVVGSEVLYDEIRRFRERSGIPVIASLGEIATSGGYYVSLACSEIVAQPNSITGSIGVIMPTLNFSEGLAKLGIQPRAIVSGPNKALADPLSPPHDEHFAILQGMVDQMYASFRGRVTERRPGIPAEMLDRATDGRVFTGAAALDIGLVDSLGGLREAFDRAKTLADLDTATLVKFHDAGAYIETAYARAPNDAPEVNLSLLNLDLESLGGFAFGGAYYLWSPMLITGR